MTARATFTQSELDRASRVAVAHGLRVRVVLPEDKGRAEIILEPIEAEKPVDRKEGPKQW